MSTAHLLKQLMLAHRENAYQLAERSGVPQPTIQRIVSGKHADPRSSTLRKLAKAYGITESQLRDAAAAYPPPGMESMPLGQFLYSKSQAYNNTVRIEPLLFPTLHMQSIVSIQIRRSWLEQRGMPVAESLRVFNNSGDSMEPTFFDADMLLVDISRTQVKDDGVYVLNIQDKLYVRRIRVRVDGRFEISSDNPQIKTVDVIDPNNLPPSLGLVVAAWSNRNFKY